MTAIRNVVGIAIKIDDEWVEWTGGVTATLDLSEILAILNITLSEFRDAVTGISPDNKNLQNLYAKINDVLNELALKTKPSDFQNIIGTVDIGSLPPISVFTNQEISYTGTSGDVFADILDLDMRKISSIGFSLKNTGNNVLTYLIQSKKFHNGDILNTMWEGDIAVGENINKELGARYSRLFIKIKNKVSGQNTNWKLESSYLEI